MTPAQRAILAKAKKDGLKPSEQASEFLLHDLVEAALQQLKNYSVAWKNLSEKEQDASIASMTEALKESVTDAIRIIMSAGASAIPFKLKSLTIDGKLKVTGLVEGDHPERHALTDKAHDKSEILLILSPRDYFEGMEDVKGEKDQKSLKLDEPDAAKPKEEKKPASGKATGKNVADIASAVAFKPAELDKAKAFVEQYRTPTTAGVQNALSIGFNKAEAILAELARQGLIIAEEGEKGPTYSMPPLAEKPLTKAQQKKADEALEKAIEAQDFTGTKTLTDDLYAAVKSRVIKDQKVSAGGLSVIFGVDIPVIDEAIDRLEMETVISEEDEMGSRVVFDTE